MRARQATFERDIPATSAGSVPAALRGHGLLVARLAWLMAALVVVALLIAAIPPRIADLRTVCSTASCTWMQLRPADAQALHAHGMPIAAYVAYHLALSAVLAVVCLVVAVLIVWRKSDEPIALLVALVLLTLPSSLGPVNETLLRAHPDWRPLVRFSELLRWLPFAYAFYLFPDGRFVPRWTRFLAAAWTVGVPLSLFLPGSPVDPNGWPGPLSAVFYLFVYGSLPVAQVWRYRRCADPMQRQQTKWVVLGFGVAMLGFIGGILLDALVGLQEHPGWFASMAAVGALYLAMTLIPLSLGVAILKYRLWEIDVLINRALVYGALTVCIAALYVVIVGALGALFRTRGNLGLSLVGTGLIAVLVHPLRQQLQRGVNRLLYGQRDEPYTVLSRLGRQLEGTLVPDAVLATIVETVRQALKLPYAAIALWHDQDFEIVAATGIPVDNPLRVPLIRQQETVGELLLAPRAPGEALGPADQRLLGDLARQAGVAAHAVQLTLHLQRLTAELQRARERLVTTREEERRRLRRDLHDGLGAQLAGLSMQAGALRSLIAADPAAARSQVAELQTELRTAVADIRRLVYGLRPPALDEVGLVAALRQRASAYSAGAALADQSAIATSHLPPRVSLAIAEPLPALPAAVEVAVYRIVEEALTNMVRHARARTCVVRLVVSETVELTICDDGAGLTEQHRTGVGLLSMRERAEELGGTCQVISEPAGGTSVRVRIPLAEV